MPLPAVLSIAGSDSGGGAGIQADLKAFARCGVHGMTAITALTAQSTVGVTGVHPVPGEFIVEQVRAVAEDIGVDAVKIGMLGTAETVRAVRDALALLDDDVPIVIDPVMVAESGAVLLDAAARAALVTELLPLATAITPNLPEARVLVASAAAARASGDAPAGVAAPRADVAGDAADAAGVAGGAADAAGVAGGAAGSAGVAGGAAGSAGVAGGAAGSAGVAGGTAGSAGTAGDAVGAAGVAAGTADRVGDGGDDAEDLARALHALGPANVIVTGGHRDEIVDVLFDGRTITRLRGERYPDGAAHGSGCTHSSALAAHLALGFDIADAAAAARRIAAEAVRDGHRSIGAGAGPVNVLGVGVERPAPIARVT